MIILFYYNFALILVYCYAEVSHSNKDSFDKSTPDTFSNKKEELNVDSFYKECRFVDFFNFLGDKCTRRWKGSGLLSRSLGLKFGVFRYRDYFQNGSDQKILPGPVLL